jgi:hypothetical protein
MEKQTRRTFVASAVALGATTAASAMTTMTQKNKKPLAHHVFFWLKNRDSKEDLKKLVEGLQTLKGIKSVKEIHIGLPATTEQRPVVDSSYSASELIFFDDIAGQDAYQVDPIHVKFVEQCSHLWEKVIVYDSIDV